jgi:hypothetical protein
MTDGIERINIEGKGRLSRPVSGGGPASLRDLVPVVIKYLGL